VTVPSLRVGAPRRLLLRHLTSSRLCPNIVVVARQRRWVVRWLRSLDRGGGSCAEGGSVTGGIKTRPMRAISPADARAILAKPADALEQDPGKASDAGGSGSARALAVEGLQASLASGMLAQGTSDALFFSGRCGWGTINLCIGTRKGLLCLLIFLPCMYACVDLLNIFHSSLN
jgi:hypothetical protein